MNSQIHKLIHIRFALESSIFSLFLVTILIKKNFFLANTSMFIEDTKEVKPSRDLIELLYCQQNSKKFYFTSFSLFLPILRFVAEVKTNLICGYNLWLENGDVKGHHLGFYILTEKSVKWLFSGQLPPSKIAPRTIIPSP